MKPKPKRQICKAEADFSEKLEEIFSKIKTGTPLTVTNKTRLKLWIEELMIIEIAKATRGMRLSD